MGARNNNGSFNISRNAIDVLIRNKATAWQIGAYLTLARHTTADNKFSTASLKAIYNATGASNNRGGAAERNVNDLLNMRDGGKVPFPLYRPEVWQKATKEIIPDIPHDLHRVRFVINDFGCDERVWFPNSLVDGVGRFVQPLKRLKQCGDIAARLLLMFYRNNNMEEFGGVPPFGNAYTKYSLEHVCTTHDFAFWRADVDGNVSFKDLSLTALGVTAFSKDEKKQQLRSLWNALETLVSRGFVNEIVTVLDGSPENIDSRPLYVLHSKERHGHADNSLDMAQLNDQLMQKVTGESFADSQGRFRDTFPVIVRAGIQPHVVGIYRLRFRISNPRNAGVNAAWGRMKDDARDMTNDLLSLSERVGIESDGLNEIHGKPVKKDAMEETEYF